METNNIDNQIKKQLEQRTLEPSAKSWENLRSKLDKKDKKTTPLYWWMGVAASFIGGILLVSLIFNKPEPIPQIQVTENNQEVILETKDEHILDESTQIHETLAHEEKIPIEKSRQKEVFQAVEENKSNKVIEPMKTEDLVENLQQIPVNIEEALVETAEKIRKPDMTKTEVDALLEQAMAEIKTRKSQNNEAISANQLLEVVEDEVEQSFRERVFELLKDGFNVSRDALANRNQ